MKRVTDDAELMLALKEHDHSIGIWVCSDSMEPGHRYFVLDSQGRAWMTCPETEQELDEGRIPWPRSPEGKKFFGRMKA